MTTSHLTPGHVLGHFRLIEEIGAGGMGIVYRAWDTRLEREVAVKVLNPKTPIDGSARKRFRREALMLSKLNHPNVESVYDFHTENGVDYLVLEYVPGMSLDDRIESGALTEKEVLAIAIQLASGLAAAHEQRILHRDLKPGNMRLTPQNTLKILDFGLAELFAPGEETITQTVTVQSPMAGTPAYLSPEQVEGQEPDVRSDIYSAGVVLYQLITGTLPYPKRGPSLREAIVNTPPPHPSSRNKKISGPFESVILKCLEKDPGLRYQSANELLDDLNEIGRLSGPHRPVGVVIRRSRYKRLWSIAAVVLLITIGLGVAFRKNLKIWLGIAPEPVSIAVLPLQNRTGDPLLDYLGAGISEALTDDLSRVPDLQVTAEDVARRYAGDKADPREVGRALDVTSILDGSITARGDKIRVPIELINVKTGRNVWGQIYEGDLSHLADLQNQISTDVAYRLKLKFDPNMKARLKRQYTTNPSAYDAYLKGRYHLAQRSPDSLQQAINDFQDAIDRDSQYAPAYAGLADCYSLLAYYGIQKPVPLLTKAMSYSQQALEMDSTLGEAYTSRALARTILNFDWQGAETDYKRAIELDPAYITAHTWYGLALLTPLSRPAEAASQLAYTQAADPNSLVTTISLATLSYLSGNPDKAIEIVDSHIHQPFEPAIQVLAVAYLAKNMNDKVISMLEGNSLPQDVIRQRAVPLGIAYARTGQKAKALQQLKIAESAVEQGYPLSCETAALYTVLDNHQKALDMLELAYERRESNIIFLNVNPLLLPLHSEPRFKKLLQKANIS
ncbi:MAG: protein kinase [Candidatus Korobacteraceae bacterium]